MRLVARKLRWRLGDRYVDVRDDPGESEGYPSIPGLVGIYSNPPGVEPLRVLLAEGAVHLETSDGLESIPLGDVLAVHLPDHKGGSGQVSLDCVNGTTIRFLVSGRDGSNEDVWLLGRAIQEAAELDG